MLSQKLALAAAGNAADGNLYADDVFSVTLRDGTGSTGTITNGIDLAAEGGMIWTKRRNTTDAHTICDSARGKTGTYYDEFGPDNTYNTQTNRAWGVTSFNSNGYSIGGTDNQFNGTGNNYVDWVFRRAPGFFDCVTYTGDGQSGRTVAHSLGSVPGCIIVKRTDSSDGWAVYHKDTEGLFSYDPANNLLTVMNSNGNASGATAYWNDTTPTSSVFTLGSNTIVNGSGMSYVAYIFASESPVFGENADESIIKCGGYTGNGTSGSSVNTIDLGFEPQWLMIKRTNSGGNWLLFDTMRGFTTVGVQDEYLYANSSAAGANHQYGGPTATGFQVEGIDGDANANGGKYIYVAIRRPHKPPSAATEVFNPDYWYGTNSSVAAYLGHPADTHILFSGSSSLNALVRTRLTGESYLTTSTTAAEVYQSTVGWESMLGYIHGGGTGTIDTNTINYTFRRAPGFLDVVAYTGTGSSRNIKHNLGVAPELIITKRRDSASSLGWIVGSYYWFDSTRWDRQGRLNETGNGLAGGGGYEPASSHSATQYPVDATGDVNASGGTFVSLLFATLAGISKVGSYAGTSNNINVDCGFTAGARFVLIKRADTYVASGHWYVWDSEQGIVSGNDPYVRLDVGGASAVTGTDYIDPLNSGFTVTSSAPSGLNESGGTYIFLAIA
tara:strand:- start:403 stop:2406 length:2004 start_codon:yes stop_codon:yes gene_type:complete